MNQNNGSDIKLIKKAQVTAWMVLLISFSLFVLACLGGTAGVYWFFFKSPTDMTVRLWVSQGSLTVMQADGTNLLITNNDKQDFVPQNATIQSNGSSQGYLTFEDTYSGEVISTIFLLPGSSLTLRSATRPRFEWSSESYTVALSNNAGHFAIDIPARIHRAIVVNMESALGTARFSQDGSYFLDANDRREQLYAQSGTALMYTSDRAVQVVGGMQGVLQKEQNSMTVLPYPYIIANWDPPIGYTFGLDNFPDDPATLSQADREEKSRLPLLWACYNKVDKQNETPGTWIRERFDERVVLHMFRTGLGLDHGETGCKYTIGPSAGRLDELNATTLSIRAKLLLKDQDVTTCGIRGSECPIMLQLTYISADGVVRVWRHGFYAIRPADDNNPIACDTCLNAHEQVNKGVWFIYDSGDLFNLLPQDQRPVQLEEILVYSSGHQYDIALADLAVLVGTP